MTLYRRWPGNQTLLADLMTREWQSVVGVAATGAEGTARERIADTIVATVRALRTNELVQRIVDVDPEVLLPYLLDRRGRSQQYVADATATSSSELVGRSFSLPQDPWLPRIPPRARSGPRGRPCPGCSGRGRPGGRDDGTPYAAAPRRAAIG